MTISIAQAQLFFLALVRVMAIIINVPVLAGTSVPNQVKIGLGVLITMIILPWQPLPADAGSMSLPVFGMAIIRELLIGILAGFGALLVFQALQMAASMMGMLSGFASSRILNPALDTSGSAMEELFLLTAILIFLALNGHHDFLLGVQRTFIAVPLNHPLPDFSVERLMQLTSQMIVAGIQLSLPLVGALLLTDITLGLLSRVAPQIQVFFLGIPLKVGLGLIALSLSLNALLPVLSEMFHKIGQNSLRLLGG